MKKIDFRDMNRFRCKPTSPNEINNTVDLKEINKLNIHHDEYLSAYKGENENENENDDEIGIGNGIDHYIQIQNGELKNSFNITNNNNNNDYQDDNRNENNIQNKSNDHNPIVIFITKCTSFKNSLLIILIQLLNLSIILAFKLRDVNLKLFKLLNSINLYLIEFLIFLIYSIISILNSFSLTTNIDTINNINTPENLKIEDIHFLFWNDYKISSSNDFKHLKYSPYPLPFNHLLNLKSILDLMNITNNNDADKNPEIKPMSINPINNTNNTITNDDEIVEKLDSQSTKTSSSKHSMVHIKKKFTPHRNKKTTTTVATNGNTKNTENNTNDNTVDNANDITNTSSDITGSTILSPAPLNADTLPQSNPVLATADPVISVQRKNLFRLSSHLRSRK
ncbi:uncharacterized protein ASCRUDRAFT_68356 [Ascoidea rubescens DSM 1968]|uniref:Uncharacterized protein n=1 Tax=Ascoidea rubescens DSM 1968 TaxID=1344418 RepID=A0A1D2VRZ7_9ASCO|nr:hypothetical protein ASCRUDRAFT_68356 [Ascoidea rubescens DSM 1968]ODV64370.1 hypothetical protein ASCRUDRAFT_68356 [Ascoidea rubescens DSM 1968]